MAKTRELWLRDELLSNRPVSGTSALRASYVHRIDTGNAGIGLTVPAVSAV
jgi:hypothetical protein